MLDVTNACLEEQDRFEHDRRSEKGLRKAGVPYPITLNATNKLTRVIVLFVYPDDVRRAENAMAKLVRGWVLSRLGPTVAPADVDQAKLRRGIDRSVRTADNAVVVYLSNDPRNIYATEKSHRVVDDCVTIVKEPDAFSNWAGAFSSAMHDRPFSFRSS
jgi:hypothetical protein